MMSIVQQIHTQDACGVTVGSEHFEIRREEQAKVCVFNAGTIRVFRVAQELKKRGMLSKCVTSLYLSESIAKTFLNHRFPRYFERLIEQKIVNRRCPDLHGSVLQWPWAELVHLGFSRLRIGNQNAWIRWRNHKFGQWVASHALDGVDLVWGFDTSSLEVFQRAKQRGISCVLDMSIAHPSEGERILRQHASSRPEYAADLGEICKPHEEIENRAKEMELADIVVATSNFTKASLEEFGVPTEKILLNPLGVDIDAFTPYQGMKTTSPIIFLFVGWFSQRKGIYYALEAWEKARMDNKAELWLVGGSRDQLRCWKRQLPNGVKILGPIAHHRITEIYRKAHVFIFPSLLEGFPKVVLEAMASGLPVVGTDYLLQGVVKTGHNGILVRAGHINDIAETIRELVNHPSMIEKMGNAARKCAEEYTWTAYGDRCAAICKTLAKSFDS